MKYERCVVAFVDILGYRELVKKSETCDSKRQELSNLVSDLQDLIPDLNKKMNKSFPAEHIPANMTFSDSIILHLPVDKVQEQHRLKYSATLIVVFRCIQIAQFFLDRGYLVRGGIDVGPLWTDGKNFVGPAFMNAYFLEQKSIYPVVQLSQNAIDELKSAGSGFGNIACIEYDDMVIVNTPYMHFRTDEYFEDRYGRYAGILVEMTEKTKLISCQEQKLKIQKKLHWFKELLAHVAKIEDVDNQIILKAPYYFDAFENKVEIEKYGLKKLVISSLNILLEDYDHGSLGDKISDLLTELENE